MAREDEIRLIAYSIWQEEDCPDGRDCEHWYRAEAIWEQRAPASSAKAESKPAAKQEARPKAARKKSPKS